MIGDQESILICPGSGECGPESRLARQVADRCPFRGREPLNLLLGFAVGIQLEILPGQFGICRNELDRFTELFVEPSHHIRTAPYRAVHRVLQPFRIQWPAQRDIELHGIQVVAALQPFRRQVRVEQQSLLQRRQRQDVGNFVLLVQLIDLLLSQPRGHDVRRAQSSPATTDMRTDSGQ